MDVSQFWQNNRGWVGWSLIIILFRRCDRNLFSVIELNDFEIVHLAFAVAQTYASL